MSVNSISGNINSVCSLLKSYSGKTAAASTSSVASSSMLPRLSGEMKSAIASALQKSDSSSDPNEIIRETIQKVLSGNKNVDTTLKIDDEAFSDYLQLMGVDGGALNQDIQTAVGNYQWETGKQPDFSKIFKASPKAKLVDVAA
jgi:hypothetical protein